MNDLSSEENENVIDVFVLSRSETGAPVTPEHLEQKGYRVTLFSDSDRLLETLRYGKPNLLVCDSLSLGQEAFDVCRQIKADNDLWMIPVLVVTTAGNLSDLLFVLDCNADNFIASPFDSSYLVSLVEVMLVTPVAQPTPEQIKTQFKIQHDDHLFVVTADRRRLLEFLLSSFEIAVNKTGELSRAGSEIRLLSDRLTRSEETVAEQARVIDILNATVQEKDTAIGTLDARLLDATEQIATLTREKDFLIQEREENRAQIDSMEETNRNLVQERDYAASAHSTEAGDLRAQIAARESELSAACTDLGETKTALLKETSRREDAETMLAELLPEKEKTEKALRALTLEFEQVKAALASEKNRAGTAEQEAKALLQAKTQAAQDLTTIIDALKSTARQQAEELIRFRDTQASDADTIAGLESRLLAVSAEKEQFEASLKKTADDLRKELDDTRKKVVAATTSLEAKNHEAAALEAACREEKAGREQALVQVGDLNADLEAARQLLSEEKREHALAVESLEAALAGRDSAIEALKGEHNEVRTTLDAHRDDLARLNGELSRVSDERDALTAQLRESAARSKRSSPPLQRTRQSLIPVSAPSPKNSTR
jgi:DNA-binding response OmpR family regulator